MASDPDHRRFRVSLAETGSEVLAAQRLRYEVFATEMAASLPSEDEGLDRDAFDPHCEHLLVRDEATGRVVGTYRILTATRAAEAGGFYAETEFDLGHLGGQRRRMMEVGRACVHPDYRNGVVISLLWSGLGACIQSHEPELVIGCASIPVLGDPPTAARICRRLKRDHLAPPEWRVVPRRPFRLDTIDGSAEVRIPPLIRGYLKMGALVCGDAAWDADFGTADVLIVLAVRRMKQSYIHRFLKAS